MGEWTELYGPYTWNQALGTGKGRHSPFPQDPHGLVAEADAGLHGEHLCDDPRWEDTQVMGGTVRESVGGL